MATTDNLSIWRQRIHFYGATVVWADRVMSASGACLKMMTMELTEPEMKRLKEASNPVPQHDYGLALQSAVSWLGDRYLLAEPVSRRSSEHKPFFVEPRRWHVVQRANGPARRKH